jgi:hypothetical protein
MFLLLPVLACAPPTTYVTTGTYVAAFAAVDGEVFAEDSLGGVLLIVDVDAGTAVLTTYDAPDAQTYPMTLTERDPDDWVRGCPTNWSSIHEQTFDLDASALSVGPAALTAPALAASCSGEDVQLISADVEADHIDFRPL